MHFKVFQPGLPEYKLLRFRFTKGYVHLQMLIDFSPCGMGHLPLMPLPVDSRAPQAHPDDENLL